MRGTELAGWLALAGVSLALAWATATGEAPTADVPPMPAPLTRLPTAAEQASVEALARAVRSELEASGARSGELPPLHELEGMAPDGTPWLPSGLPDNPLAPGVAGVMPGCGDTPPPPEGIDWRYCAAPLRFEPAHVGRPDATQSGKL